MKVKGSVILITGGAKRIGAAIAKNLAAGGAHVLIHYNRSKRSARALQQKLQREFKVKVDLLQGDLGDLTALNSMADQAWQIKKRIDVLINNASTFYPTRMGQVREQDWDNLFAINAKAPFFLSEKIGMKMKARGRGKIINIADWAVDKPYPSYLPYCASKAALINFGEGMAKFFAPEVQVNTILPGPILWPEKISEKNKKRVLDQTPMGRLGDPKDIANTVNFLIAGNDFMTGSRIHVDGGRHID